MSCAKITCREQFPLLPPGVMLDVVTLNWFSCTNDYARKRLSREKHRCTSLIFLEESGWLYTGKHDISQY